MANLNEIDVPIALEHKTKLDLSCDHMTTMDFMLLQPVFYRHQIKKESMSIKAKSVVRPAPMEVPCFGRLRQNLRAFFVPYRLVFPNWNEFYNDTIASNYNYNSLVAEVPQFTSDTLCQMFFTDSNTNTYLSSVVSTGEDFTYQGVKYKLTYVGRRILCILESLGYRLLPDTKNNSNTPVVYNALALLAFVKIYVDWYANSQYLNSYEVLLVDRLLKYNDPTSKLVLTEQQIWDLLHLCLFTIYDNEDYYVNAWDNPVSPNSGQYTSFSFTDPTSSAGARVVTNSMGSPEMRIANSPEDSFTVNGVTYHVPTLQNSVGTTYIHEALKKLTDFQKRHALAGARAIDRVLAQYGVVTDSLKQMRSIYVGSQSVDINIGSVFATATSTDGTDSSSTGDYAGCGYGDAEKSWNFSPDEEGIFIVMSSIIPVGDLVQGYDRNNVHLDKFDFFVPEFDSLGVQAIQKGEVYTSDGDSFCNNPSKYLGVFGFTGRYGEYKRPKSFVTGDFRLPNFYQGGDSWHLSRLFNDSSWTGGTANGLVHSLSFTRSLDAIQYHRIFQDTSGDYNPFYCFLHFDVGVYAPCKPLFETYEFDENSKRVPTENGNKLN